jgi:hypothetical protein
LFLTPASQLAIVGASSNTMLKIIAKGDEATPKAVSKELGLLAVQTATIIAAQKAWQTIVSKRLLNPFNQAFAAVAIPVVIGGVTSYLIDEEEGLQNYFEFLDVATDPEQTDQATLLTAWSLGTIWKFYTGGGQNKKEGFFEFEN